MDEILRRFNDAKVRYILVGGQAIRLLGMPRFTMDWDFFIPPRDEANFERINELLEAELDSPLLPLGRKGEGFVQTYQTQHGVLQFHLLIPGIRNFDDAEKSSTLKMNENGVPVRTLSIRDFLVAKEATNRPQDIHDIKFLRELLKES